MRATQRQANDSLCEAIRAKRKPSGDELDVPLSQRILHHLLILLDLSDEEITKY